MIVLRQGRLQAAISPLGAELQQLRRDGEELLWQPQPGIWHQSAPWLFPFVGRPRGGGFRHRGQWHALALHGFAAQSRFEILAQDESAVRLRLDGHPDFPFAFALDIGYRLQDQGLDIELEVHNPGEELLPFALGAHPGFALSGRLDDWSLEFEQAEADAVWRLDPEPPPWGLRARAPEPFAWTAPRRLQLRADLFDRDALILDPLRSRWVALHHRERGECLRFELGGAPQLGLWARPGAPYVCIEPWWGRDDDADAPETLLDKPQLQRLAPGQRFSARLGIRC